MKYLLLSLSFFFFVGNVHAQDAAKTKCNTDYVSSILDVSLNFFSDKAEKKSCTPTPSCGSATAQKVASNAANCNPQNCDPANCKPENCPPGCKPGDPECKLAVATTQVASNETKPVKVE